MNKIEEKVQLNVPEKFKFTLAYYLDVGLTQLRIVIELFSLPL